MTIAARLAEALRLLIHSSEIEANEKGLGGYHAARIADARAAYGEYAMLPTQPPAAVPSMDNVLFFVDMLRRLLEPADLNEPWHFHARKAVNEIQAQLRALTAPGDAPLRELVAVWRGTAEGLARLHGHGENDPYPWNRCADQLEAALNSALPPTK